MTDSTTSTNTATDTVAQDPAAIERDIRRTQDEMSQTVDRIGDQLTPRNLMNALFDKAESNDIDARYLIDGARRNPLALGMIAGGLIWLVSDSDAKFPSLGSKAPSTPRQKDPYHGDYVAHMERIERNPDEDDLAYQRRRDVARANYFMIERGHEEDEGGFRARLDQAAEAFRNKRQALAETTRHAGESLRNAGGSLRDGSGAMIDRTRQAYSSNPLIGGMIAAAAGAIVGAAMPLTRTEEQKLSGIGESAREAIGEQKDQLLSVAREKKDELVAKVEDAAHPSEAQQPQQQPAVRPMPVT